MLTQGIDFLGYIQFKDHRLLRLSTQKRMIRSLKQSELDFLNQTISFDSVYQTIQSYKGLLSHADTFLLQKNLGLS